MTDIEKARRLFRDAGLAFPTIPDELALRLREQGNKRLPMRNNISDKHGSSWLFSTREIEMSSYNLQHYVHEAEHGLVDDYVILPHSGHGINSYAIQYYLVRGPLCMLLHLCWGGVYSDAKADAATIRDCFVMADRVVLAAQSARKFQVGERLTIMGSSFYGSYWLPPGKRRRGEIEGREGPLKVLNQALDWLTIEKRVGKGTTRSKKKR